MKKLIEIEQNITKDHLKTLSTHKERMKVFLFEEAGVGIKERVNREIDMIEMFLTAMKYEGDTLLKMCNSCNQEIKFTAWDN